MVCFLPVDFLGFTSISIISIYNINISSGVFTGISVLPSKCFTFHVINLEQEFSSATLSIKASEKLIFTLIFSKTLSNNCSMKSSGDAL